MTKVVRNRTRLSAAATFAAALAFAVGSGVPSGASADEASAKRMLKAMSDYMGAQKAFSLAYDVTLEIVTKDNQKLAIASSGTMVLQRPDKVRITRHGGFARVNAMFDGKTLTLFGQNANAYGQVDVPGTIDNLVDVLRDKHERPIPGADLLLSNIYEKLMPDVIDAKDLGSGVIGNVECDHLAFRTEEVDWQIWIAQGPRPYPCRYVITSKKAPNGPQYSIQIRDWKAGNAVKAGDFSFKNTTNAKKFDLKDLPDAGDLPAIFQQGASR